MERGGGDGYWRMVLRNPGMDAFPMYMNRKATPVWCGYGSSFNIRPKTITDMDGDGRVGLLSLQARNHWKRARKPLVIDGFSHAEILSRKEVIEHVLDIISINDSTSMTR